MLAYLDDLDSKVEAMQRLIAEPHATGDWTRMAPMFERPIYRVRTLEPVAANEPEAKPPTPPLTDAVPPLNLKKRMICRENQPCVRIISTRRLRAWRACSKTAISNCDFRQPPKALPAAP